MPKLIFTDPKFSGQVYELALEQILVGRGEKNNLVIPDRSVSHEHCEILVYGPEVIVRDLGSSNGTRVNGQLLKNQQTQLKHGHTLRLGHVEARLELERPSDLHNTSVTAMYAYKEALAQPVPSAKPNEHEVLTPAPGASHSHTVLLPNKNSGAN